MITTLVFREIPGRDRAKPKACSLCGASVSESFQVLHFQWHEEIKDQLAEEGLKRRRPTGGQVAPMVAPKIKPSTHIPPPPGTIG